GRGRVLAGPARAPAAHALAAGAPEHGPGGEIPRAHGGAAQPTGQGLAVVDVEGLLPRHHLRILVPVLAGAAGALDDPGLDIAVRRLGGDDPARARPI